MVKDFKRWTTQLAATVLYNGRGAANLLGADMTWKNVCLPGVNCGYCRYAEAGCPWGLTPAYPDRFYFTFGLAGLGAAHLVRSVFGTDDLWLAVSVWLGAGVFR